MSIRQLYELQTIEQEIAAHERELAQAQAKVGESPGLKNARSALTEAVNALEAGAKEQRATEASIADLTAKMTVAAESLYSGRVKNPKELQNLQHELEIFKAQRDPLEEKDLDLMEKLELSHSSVSKRSVELAAAESVWWQEQAAIVERIEAIKLNLDGAKARHGEFLRGVAPADLTLYVQTKQGRGQAVAPVVQGTCGKCRLTLSSAENQRVRSGQTVVCSSCGRLLFFE